MSDTRDLASATKQSVAASLTAAIVTAAGRPHSIEEVLSIHSDIMNALYPLHGSGAYEAWSKERDDRLKKVRK